MYSTSQSFGALEVLEAGKGNSDVALCTAYWPHIYAKPFSVSSRFSPRYHGQATRHFSTFGSNLTLIVLVFLNLPIQVHFEVQLQKRHDGASQAKIQGRGSAR